MSVKRCLVLVAIGLIFLPVGLLFTYVPTLLSLSLMGWVPLIAWGLLCAFLYRLEENKFFFFLLLHLGIIVALILALMGEAVPVLSEISAIIFSPFLTAAWSIMSSLPMVGSLNLTLSLISFCLVIIAAFLFCAIRWIFFR